MDNIWRRIMERVHASPLMTDVADTPGLLEELQKCNRSLDIVEKVCVCVCVCLCVCVCVCV
jgi:hypothetical protein